MAKLLLGGDLQNPKLNEETARQILALIRNPITTVTHNLTQPSTSNSQQESVTKVPASLVTARLTNPRDTTTTTTERVDATYQKNPSSEVHRADN